MVSVSVQNYGGSAEAVTDEVITFEILLSEALELKEADLDTTNCNNPVFAVVAATTVELACTVVHGESTTVGVPEGAIRDPTGNPNEAASRTMYAGELPLSFSLFNLG